ncbi:MAG: 2-methylcitrate dehydratase PrpD [Gammaproteobacteria bacterium]|jgi:2-methylcitrate dehydratase PrpD
MNARPISDVSDADMSSFQRALGELTHWACSVRFDELPAAVRERAAMVLVDDLSAMIAGFSDPECAALTDLMFRTGGAGEASVFNGRNGRSDRYTAASINAAAGTWCELDEGYRRTLCHAGIYVVPALLAEAQARDATMSDVLRALATAYEVVTRIARGFPGTTRELHPHGCFSAVGAAAAVALLRNEPPAMLAQVLNTASLMINPTTLAQAFDGALARNVFTAIGTGNGMRAADWAPIGISAVDSAAVGAYAVGLGAGIDAAALVNDLGEDWAILSNFQRRFACCQFGHSTIESTLDLLAQMPAQHTIDDIERIVVEIHPMGYKLDNIVPVTTLGARFSLPHITAACTRLGHANVSAFFPEQITDPAIAALRERVELVPFTPVPMPPKDRPARVTWHFSDGSELMAQCESAHGEPGRPFTPQDVEEKVKNIASNAYPRLIDVAAPLMACEPDVLAQTWPSILAQFDS